MPCHNYPRARDTSWRMDFPMELWVLSSVHKWHCLLQSPSMPCNYHVLLPKISGWLIEIFLWLIFSAFPKLVFGAQDICGDYMLYGYLRTSTTRICMGDKLSFKRCQALRLQVISVFRASQISFRLQVYRLGNLAPACDMARLKARFRRALNKNTNRFVKLSLSLCGHDAYWSTVDPNGSRCCWAHKFLVVEVVCCLLEETRRLSWESWSWTRSPASFIPRRILSTLAESLGWVGSMESSLKF